MTVVTRRDREREEAQALEQLADQDERVRVIAWRCLCLLRAGYDARAAGILAPRILFHDFVDLHQACRLVEGGCPPETALRILV